MGAAYESGVSGLITADPRSAFLAYGDAQRGNSLAAQPPYSASAPTFRRLAFDVPAQVQLANDTRAEAKPAARISAITGWAGAAEANLVRPQLIPP
jgi:hypothetical protein